jgi:hypothetical protein
MLPQPPPDAPAPPPSEAALRSIRWRNWIVGLGIGSILLWVLAGLTQPMVIRSRKKSDLTEAINNARQIGLALFEFEAAYGGFPNDQTAREVKAATLSGLNLGSSSSNDYFRQLFAAEICQGESMFYARSPQTSKPDNIFTGSEALKKRECAFAYIPGITTKHPPGTPIVVFPLISGKLTFDKKLCDKHYSGKAVILRLDTSVTTAPVDASGRVWFNGKDLFDPSQPFWGGKAPVVKWPE